MQYLLSRMNCSTALQSQLQQRDEHNFNEIWVFISVNVTHINENATIIYIVFTDFGSNNNVR